MESKGSGVRKLQVWLLVGGVIFFSLSYDSASARDYYLGRAELAAADDLQILPDNLLEFTGHPGGPFMPTQIFYQLTNNGGDPISWSVAQPLWLDVNPLSGVLTSGESISVQCIPNATAYSYTEGFYSGLLTFTNLTSSEQYTRDLNLKVFTEPKIWYDPTFFNVALPQGYRHTETLTIGNGGDDILNFALLGQQTNFAPMLEPFTADLTDTESPADIGLSGYNIDISQLEVGTYVPGELLVSFAPRPDKSYPHALEQQGIVSALGGGSILHEYEIISGLCRIKLAEGVSVAEALADYNQSDDILCATPNFMNQIHAVYPNDTRFHELWGLHNTGQFAGTVDVDLDMPEAWEIATGSTDIIVGIIDTGVDYTHPDLAGNMWTNTAELNGAVNIDDDGNGFIDDIYGYDFINNDSNPMDDNNHGTHVAGTIGAAGNNGEGVVGVCWRVKIMALKFSGDNGYGSDGDALLALDYAVQMGVNLINTSWGRPGIPSPIVEAAINQAGDEGVLLVSSVGNYNNNNDILPNYPSGYNCDNIIAVMAHDYNGERSVWTSGSSNYGATSVDLSAPGSNILSCVRGGGYMLNDGTSMAAPHVAGAAALIWSFNPELNYQGIKDIILQNVEPVAALDGLNATGGRLNVYNALLASGTPWIDYQPQSGVAAIGQPQDVQIIFDADQAPGLYEGHINLYSNDPFHSINTILTTMEVKFVDYFTEYFDIADNDLSYRSLTFTPGDFFNYYHVCLQAAPGFPVDPAGGTILALQDDDYKAVNLPPGKKINFYGVDYDTFYVGSNGYISFISGDYRYIESLRNHFSLPRIAGLFDDLNPTAGGTISWKSSADRVVVTFENIAEFHIGATNSFQIEMRDNGIIRITWLEIAARDGLAGLSRGGGIPAYFLEDDLSGLCNCMDINCDSLVNLRDYSILASYWNQTGCPSMNFWCDTSDFDRDGDVDLIDLSLLARLWLIYQGN